MIAFGALPARAETPEEQLAAASALFDAKKYVEAAQKLDLFLAANPKHAKTGAAALTLGRSLAELKQWAKAVPAYEKAIASKEPAVLQTAQLGLGEAAVQSGQWEKAADALDAAVKTPLRPEQAPIAWYWLAQADFQLKRYAGAEEAYVKVTRDYGRADFVDDAWFGAGIAALRQGKAEPARQRLRAVVDRYPKSQDRPQALLLLAQLDMDAKRYREARASYEALLQLPEGPDTNELRASAEEGLVSALLELQDYAAASSRLDALLSRLPATDPKRFRAQLSVGHCRFRQRQYDGALSAYREAAKATDQAVAGEGNYWAANTLIAQGKPLDAAIEYTKLVTKYPKHELAAKAQYKAGDALIAAKQGEQAARAYRLVVENFPQSPEAAEARKALGDIANLVDDPAQLAIALKSAPPAERAKGTVRLGRLYLQAKKYPEAAAALTELQKTKPEPDNAVLAEGSYLLGLALEAQQKGQPASAAYAEAVRRTPAATWAGDAQGRLAWLYLEQKQPANAEKAAAAALDAKPNADAERQARLALVQAQLDQEKWDAALDGCRLILSKNPPPDAVATVVYTQAWVSEKRGKPDEALPQWERLARDFPKSDYAPEAMLHVGDARFKAEKYEEARAQYAALLAAAPKSPLAPEARFKLGSALYHLDKAMEAGTEFDAVAADKSAGDYVPEALYWSGVAFDKAGKKDEAIQRLSRLVMLFPKHERVANAKIRLAALKAVAGK